MTAPIVVATDLTARSDRPFDRAVMLAEQRGARLVIVHAVEERNGVDGRQRMQWARQALDRVVEDLTVPFEVVLEQGPAPQMLATVVEDRQAAFVVVGAARYNHVSDFFLGTAVDYLVRRATAPVLVVKERPRVPYDGIIVGTDFSERSARALGTAAVLFDGPITLVHAFSRPLSRRLEADVSLELGEAWSREEMERFLASPTLAPWRDRITPHSVESDPAGAVEKFARQYRNPVAVVGSHGWGSMAHVLLGSRASDLLTAIAQDILIVRDGLTV
jgi:nucleotide-binding universal stress UspA family protein